MEFLQKKIFYYAKLGFTSIKNCKRTGNKQGFMSVFFIPIVALIIAATIGLISLSLKIKKITQLQSSCITLNMQGQKRLGMLLTKLFALNKQVVFLHKSRKVIQAKLHIAKLLVQIQIIPILKQALNMVKTAQKVLVFKQKTLISQSYIVKQDNFYKFKKAFQKFKILKIKQNTFFTQALAITKKQIGNQAYVYKTAKQFIEKQKNQFSWSVPNDYNLGFKNIINNIWYRCTASLKQKGDQWISQLYY